MICDKLTNYENYKGINERVYRALEHAAHNDFSKSVAGRNDVDGDDIYYNFVKEGETVPLEKNTYDCLLYTSPSPRDPKTSRMPSSA